YSRRREDMGTELVRNRTRYLVIITLLVSLLVFGKLAMAETANSHRGKPAKYVILMVGDGMGIPQRMATQAYKGEALNMDTLPAQGITTTQAANRFITGSASSATSLASGLKTNINYIGIDPNHKPLSSLAEMAKQQGKKVGIVSSVSIDHATPAAFYAHVKHRKMYHEIDMALARSDFDFFGGGGLKDPRGKKSDNPQGDALALAQENGYTVVFDKASFSALDKNAGKVIAYNAWLQDAKALPYAMDMGEADITLPEFTGKAIELLENPKGFFLMVEGGKIDWACHANDAAAAITNNIAFDDAVKVALDFYKAHADETLLVVTGDHECGGLTLGFAGTKYASHFEVLKHQKVSFKKFTQEVFTPFKEKFPRAEFAQFKPLIREYFGFEFDGSDGIMALKPHELDKIQTAFEMAMTADKKTLKEPDNYLLYGGYNPLTIALTHTLSQKAGLGWTSYKHTGTPVSTSAIGKGSELFNGYYDNTDIAKKIMSVMGLNFHGAVAVR
ncbi:MAG: alkaline phosphatase, partial [Desulfobacterales bacterium]|nr:alkaline phosphatase [Desulfobacterales bacterium]